MRQRKPAGDYESPPPSPSGSEGPMSPTSPRATKAQSADETSKAESKFSKLIVRLVVGLPMIFLFYGIIYLGHGWVTWMVAALQTQIFRELVNVRYNNYRADKRKILKRDAPRFRTIQWGWFFVAMFYSYGHAATTYALLGDRQKTFERLVGVELGVCSPLACWLPLTKSFLNIGPTKQVFEKVFRVHQWVSFVLYSVTFVITILSFKKGIVKYQFEQLTWTLLTIIMVVSQMNLAVYNIFEGLFWFLLPCSLVVCNDCFAYFCGFAFGGRLLTEKGTTTLL
jgi:phosphatidate cytidylyltransferase